MGRSRRNGGEQKVHLLSRKELHLFIHSVCCQGDAGAAPTPDEVLLYFQGWVDPGVLHMVVSDHSERRGRTGSMEGAVRALAMSLLIDTETLTVAKIEAEAAREEEEQEEKRRKEREKEEKQREQAQQAKRSAAFASEDEVTRLARTVKSIEALDASYERQQGGARIDKTEAAKMKTTGDIVQGGGQEEEERGGSTPTAPAPPVVPATLAPTAVPPPAVETIAGKGGDEAKAVAVNSFIEKYAKEKESADNDGGGQQAVVMETFTPAERLPKGVKPPPTVQLHKVMLMTASRAVESSSFELFMKQKHSSADSVFRFLLTSHELHPYYLYLKQQEAARMYEVGEEQQQQQQQGQPAGAGGGDGSPSPPSSAPPPPPPLSNPNTVDLSVVMGLMGVNKTT